jgi:N-acetylglutamate synthase
MRYRPKDRLSPEDVGRRVTVRHRLPDGASTDVVGELLAVGDAIEVRKRDGSVASISADAVIAARVHPPAV